MLDGFLAKGFASKCKSLVKLTKTRIDGARRKKNAMHSFLKKDIATLLANGHDASAYGRVEGLLSELSLLHSYDFVEQYCDHILNYLNDMQKQSECPKECQETVSSLMFAAARLSDFPELRELRRLFQDKYPESLEFVNKELAQCLASKLPASMEAKVRVMVEIASEFSLNWDSKAFLLRISKPPSAHPEPRRRQTPERRSRHGSEKVDTRQPNHRQVNPCTDDPTNTRGEKNGSALSGSEHPGRRYSGEGRRRRDKKEEGEEDEEEKMIDNLLLHYSQKRPAYSPGEVKSKLMEAGKMRGNILEDSTDPERGADGVPDKVLQRGRSNSAPREQTAQPEGKTVLTHIKYLSSSVRHVHPKLPDYDDLAARFAAMKAK